MRRGVQMNRVDRRLAQFGAAAILSVSGAYVCAKQTPDPAASQDQYETAAVSPATPIGSGPRKAIMEVVPALPTHTIYRPADMSDGFAKLPVVLFANGGCLNEGNRFRWFLSEIASYGFLVIALGPIGPSAVERGPAPVRAPSISPAVAKIIPEHEQNPASHTRDLIRAMDWAVKENQRETSAYHQHLATAQIAVMGQSCGGIQALEASADPRVSTTIIWSSGFFPQGATLMGGGKAMSEEDLKLLHAPIAYISGDDVDRAYPNANADFDHINSVPVLRAYERGIPHAGTYWDQNGGEFAGIAIAWLEWQLKSDSRSARMFAGPNCGLCVNPRWVVRRKSIG